MESKKPGMLRNLRQRMLPHIRRGKSSHKQLVQLEHTMDSRMSSSVPDMRDMRQEYAPVSCSTQLQEYNSAYSSPATPLVNPARSSGGDGSGLKMQGVGREAERSEHRLSVPADSVDWASSQESFNSEKRFSSEGNSRSAWSMEPEELALPEMMTVYTPHFPSDGVSQDSSQVSPVPHNNVQPFAEGLKGSQFENEDINGDNQTSEMGNETPTMSESIRFPSRSFLLTINLKEGRNLVIRDRCGGSCTTQIT